MIIDIDRIKEELAIEMGKQVNSDDITNVKIDDISYLVDFMYGPYAYWAKLTMTGKVKKHSVRFNR